MSENPSIEIPAKLVEVFNGPAWFRGSWGGRGSGKTRSFAKMTAVYAIRMSQMGREGVIFCGREYMNSLADSSFAEIKAAILETPWMLPFFDVGETYIRTKDRRIEYIFVGLKKSLNSIKSTARILLAWIDEAEYVSEEAWVKLIPTVREADAEIWVTWNPERKNSPTHKRFRESPPDDSKFVELNWRDNPWFPKVLEKARNDDLTKRPDQYNHIWEGAFATAMEGAYFARHMTQASLDGRVTDVAREPLMSTKAFFDIGGAGAKADATSIWIVQFINQRINIIDHYTAQGQDLATHVAWLRKRGYDDVTCYLPHDGANSEKVYDVTYESALTDAGFDVEVVPNQGRGAASFRIEAARRHFGRVWFDEKRTENGRVSLGFYHEKRDPNTGAGLGPNHDWSSHDADAFGMIFIVYEMPKSPMETEARRRRMEPEEPLWVH